MASAPTKVGIFQFSGSLTTGQIPLTTIETVENSDQTLSSRRSPKSMSKNQPGNYTTDSAQGCEYEECYSTIPRSCNDPYEQFLLAQSSISLQNQRTPSSNYTTKTECHGDVQLNDLAEQFQTIKFEPDQTNESEEDEAVLPEDVRERDSFAKAVPSENELSVGHSEIKKEEFGAADWPLSPSSTSHSDQLDQTCVADLIKPVLADTTQHLMGDTMTFFHSVAMGQSQFNQRGNNQEGSSSQSASGTYLDSSPAKQSDSSSSGSKGQSSGSGQQDGQGQDDEEEKKRPRKRKRGSNPVAMYQEKKLACPYFKRNPEEHDQQGACSGPGFSDIHRLKEHLYRCHRQPVECPRCAIALTTEAELTKHLAREDRCAITINVTPPQDRGFSKEQEKQLRRRTTATKSEAEKWNDVYSILFPNDERVPSHFYEHKHIIAAEEIVARETDAVTRDQERYRIELPLIIKSKLEEAIAVELIPISERLKSLVLEIVRTAQDEYFDRIREACPSMLPLHAGTPDTNYSGPFQSSPCVQNGSATTMQPTFVVPLNRMPSNDSGFVSYHALEDCHKPQSLPPATVNAGSGPHTCPPSGHFNHHIVDQFAQTAFEGIHQTAGEVEMSASEIDTASNPNNDAYPFDVSTQENHDTVQLHAEHDFPFSGAPIVDPFEAFLENFLAFEEHTIIVDQSADPSV